MLAATVFLSFGVFPQRRLNITADGASVSLLSREDDAARLLDMAGIEAQAGDVVLVDGDHLQVERAVPVVVEADGRTLAWRTRAETVNDLLNEMRVTISPYDAVHYNGVEVAPRERLVAQESISIVVDRAVPITIVEDGREFSLQTPKDDVAAALAEAGIQLGPADEVFPALDSPVVAGMQVEIRHASAITLLTGDGSHTLYTQKETLAEALAEIGLVLGDEDRVEPPLETEVTDGMTARLVRVTGRTFIESEPVQRKTVFRPDPNLTGSQTRREQGSDGVYVREYRVTIEDGVETEKVLVSEGFDPAPVDNVIYYAASAAGQAGLAPTELNVADTMHVWATWYNAASSGKAPTDPSYGITRSGVPVTRGIVATDPAVIPLGTHLYIPGYGFAVAADTGGGIVGNMIDLGFPDGVAVDWHTGWVDIYILSP